MVEGGSVASCFGSSFTVNCESTPTTRKPSPSMLTITWCGAIPSSTTRLSGAEPIVIGPRLPKSSLWIATSGDMALLLKYSTVSTRSLAVLVAKVSAGAAAARASRAARMVVMKRVSKPPPRVSRTAKRDAAHPRAGRELGLDALDGQTLEQTLDQREVHAADDLAIARAQGLERAIAQDDLALLRAARLEAA